LEAKTPAFSHRLREKKHADAHGGEIARPRLSVGALKRLLRARRSGMLKNPLQQLWLNMYRFAAARAVRTHDDAQTPTSTSLLAEVRH
jgi:hypothetical protein